MIRIGTRGSKLALWQAGHVAEQLTASGLVAEIKIIKTKGDQIQHLGFDKMEGKGFFTKKIEEALLSEKIDIAVHSLKDLPTVGVTGLTIGGLSYRANPSDVLIVASERADHSRRLKLPANARVGTSSIRRKVQMHAFDPNLNIHDIRGNVPTRIEKLRHGDFDAILLAMAGIERLGLDLSEFVITQFNPVEFVPAPGQGVIAYQCRVEDKATRRILKRIHHSDVAACTNVERKILQLMGGGCQLPLGAFCYNDESGNFHCSASYAKDITAPLKRISISQSTFSGLAENMVEALTH